MTIKEHKEIEAIAEELMKRDMENRKKQLLEKLTALKKKEDKT